jgi:hypothetical protein
MKKIFYLTVFFGLFACNENPVKPPKKLLDEATMENILYDAAILQAVKLNSPDILQANKIDAKNYIYKKYKIDSTTYRQNNRYYASDVNKYKEMQKRILARLEKQQNTKK